MKIFSNIVPKDGDSIIKNGFVAVILALEQKKREGLLLPWSLAELLPDNEDFQWLYIWAKNLSEDTATTWLSEGVSFKFGNARLSCQIAIGALIMFLEAETARRNAQEGYIWASCCNNFSGGTKALLFNYNNQPTQLHKDVLEKASRWLKLRHVFGVEGLQNWFDTIYLQFGFTYSGFNKRLPEWLVGQNSTQSIQRLLDPTNGSKSFRTLWDLLKNYRQNNITETRLRQVITENPWVLPEWANDLVTKAKQRPELVEVIKSVNPVETEVSFLSQPVLTWDAPNLPNFSCQVTNLASLELSESSYELIIGEHLYAQLIRQEDSTYQILPSITIDLPIVTPTLFAKIVTSDNQIVYSMSLELWEASEDLTIYRLSSGQRLKDPWQEQMKASLAYVLLLASDLTVSPEPKYWQVLGKHQAKLYLLSNNWPTTTKVLLEDNLFWQPCLSATTRQVPNWAKNIKVYLANNKVIQLGEAFSLVIEHTPDIEVTFVRYDGLPVNFNKIDSKHTSSESIVLSMTIPNQKPIIRVGLTNGLESTSIVQILTLGFSGVLQLTQNGWENISNKEELSVEEAKTSQFKIFAPELWNKEKVEFKEWALMEGEVWLGRLWNKPHTINGLAGFGASLTVRQGTYNSFGGNAVTIAKSVITRGLISDIFLSVNDEEKILKLKLSRFTELDNNHHIIWWDINGLVYNLDKISVEDKTLWVINLDPEISKPIAIAIAYNGRHLGSWWSNSPHWTYLISVCGQNDHKLVAALIRWFHLPILNSRELPTICTLAMLHPKSTLIAWIQDVGLPAFLSPTEINDSWLAAMRVVFRKYFAKKNDGNKIVSALSNFDEENITNPIKALEKSISLLMRVDPLLMGKIVVGWLNDFYLLKFGNIAAKNMLQDICYNIAEVEDNSEKALQKKQKALLAEIAETMQLDQNFVQLGLINRAIESFNGKAIKPFDEGNIALAISVEPFRRLLVLEILKTIANRK